MPFDRLLNNELVIHADDLTIGMFVSRLEVPWSQTDFNPATFASHGILAQDFHTVEELQRSSKRLVIDRELSEPYAIGQIIRASTRYISSNCRLTRNGRAANGHEVTRAQIWQAQNRIRMLEAAYIEYIKGFKGKGTPNLKHVLEALANCFTAVQRNPSIMLWASRLPRPGQEHAQHGATVCILSLYFGQYLELPHKEQMHLGLAGLLHDIGELCLSQALLRQEREYLSEDRIAHRLHVGYGIDLLERDDELDPKVMSAISQHHEWVNGNGYPAGLRDYQLGDLGKILAITDAYVGMTSRKVLRRRRTPQEAMEEIIGMSGKQFDSALSYRFVESVGIYP